MFQDMLKISWYIITTGSIIISYINVLVISGVDAATIQRAAAGLPSNIYNTLAQVAGVNPSGVTPGITPRITPGFTPGYTPRTGFTPAPHTPLKRIIV